MVRNCNQQQGNHPNNNQFNQPNYSRPLERPNPNNTYPHHTVNTIETTENETEAYPAYFPRVTFEPEPKAPKYNILKDLEQHHTNVTFGQLLELSKIDT